MQAKKFSFFYSGRKLIVSLLIFLCLLLFPVVSYAEDDTAKAQGRKVSELGLDDGIYTMNVSVVDAPVGWEVVSPCRFQIKGTQMIVLLEWESKSYEYMIVQGQRIEPEKREGGSKFKIPVTVLDAETEVTAEKNDLGIVSKAACRLVFDSSSIESTGRSVSKDAAMASAGFSFFGVISIAAMVLVYLHRKMKEY